MWGWIGNVKPSGTLSEAKQNIAINEQVYQDSEYTNSSTHSKDSKKNPQSGWTIRVQPFSLCGSLSSPLRFRWAISNQSHFVCLCVSWWVGEWQKCSASCGSSGQTKRTVLCIQAVSVEEQKALRPKDCEHMPKPESISSCNTHIPCPANWTTSGWSKVSQGFFCSCCFFK